MHSEYWKPLYVRWKNTRYFFSLISWGIYCSPRTSFSCCIQVEHIKPPALHTIFNKPETQERSHGRKQHMANHSQAKFFDQKMPTSICGDIWASVTIVDAQKKSQSSTAACHFLLVLQYPLKCKYYFVYIKYNIIYLKGFFHAFSQVFQIFPQFWLKIC